MLYSSLAFLAVPVQSHHTHHRQPVVAELEGGEVVRLNLTQKLQAIFLKRVVGISGSGGVCSCNSFQDVTSVKEPVSFSPILFSQHSGVVANMAWLGLLIAVG